MNVFRFSLPCQTAAKFALAVTVGLSLFQPNFTGATPAAEVVARPAHSSQANTTQIECITPDGRLTPVSSQTSNPQPPAYLGTDNSLNCDLQEGDTVFIIPVAATAVLDRFTFVNHNPSAAGEFVIAISNSPLAPQSPNWVQVDGIVPFVHKRLFNLSLLGTGAKYVRLSFHVEKTSRFTRLQLDSGERSRIAAEPAPPAAGPEDN